MSRRAFPLAVLALAFCARPACASSADVPLSFSARDLADCAQAQMQAVGQQAVFQNAATLAVARAKFLPFISVTTSQGQYRDDVSRISGSSTGVTASQLLFSATQLASVNVAKSGLESATADTAAKELDVANAALDAIVANQRLEEQNRLAQSRLDSYVVLSKLVGETQRIGLSDSADAFQIAASVLTNKLLVQQTDFQIRQNKNLFVARFGFPLPALSDFESPSNIEPLRYAELPELRGLKFKIQQAADQQNQARRVIWPELSLEGSYSSSQLTGFTNTYGPSSEGSIRLMFDLSGLWRPNGESAAYGQLKVQQENSLRMRSDVVRSEYETLSEELNLIDSELPSLKERVELSSKARELTKFKLGLGKVSFYELQVAEDGAFTAQFELKSALFRRQQILMKTSLANLSSDEHRDRVAICRITQR